MESGWQAFKAAHRLWVIEKNYDPTLASQQTGMVLTA
jgi:hypothetical protein